MAWQNYYDYFDQPDSWGLEASVHLKGDDFSHLKFVSFLGDSLMSVFSLVVKKWLHLPHLNVAFLFYSEKFDLEKKFSEEMVLL